MATIRLKAIIDERNSWFRVNRDHAVLLAGQGYPDTNQAMKNPELDAIRAELRKLSARVTALEKLLDRIIRQKPVSERQLEKALKSRGSLELGR